MDTTQRRDELRADLLADGNPITTDAVPAWIHRPSTLRRVATELARALPPHFDRILATGTGAEALGAAVSLATGVAFATESETPVAGEDIVVIAALATDAETYRSDSVTILARHAVWATREGSQALFAAPTYARTSQGKDFA